MIDIKQLGGYLNTDDSNEVMPPSHHKMARNGRFRGSGVNQRFENIPGTTAISNSLPAGTNEMINGYYDGVGKRLFWFNYNSNNRHGIYKLSMATGVVTALLVCYTDSVDDILGFSPNYPISGINLLYRSEGEGDILHWNDRFNRPRKLNIKEAEDNTYGAAWLENYLTVARPMPLIAPSCQYKDDSTVITNNLRKKLYQFRYRYVYTDLTKSTPSPYSKLFSPVDPDSIATDIDQEKNNRIDAIINTGPADAIKIEVIARVTIGSNLDGTLFSDDFLVELLDKEELGLSNDALYTYQFYGDGSYQNILVDESIQLFDYVPKKAKAQEFLNGNVITYGGITMGNTYDETQDVDVDIELISNTLSTDQVEIVRLDGQTHTNPNEGYYFFYITGVPVVGDVYTLQNIVVVDSVTGGTSYTVSHTVISGDDINTVITSFRNQLNALAGFQATYHLIASNIPGVPTGVAINSTNGNSQVMTSTIVMNYQIPPTTASDDINIAMFKHRSRYEFGRVYFDEFGVTNGVVTTPVMKLEMPEIDTTEFEQPSIPAITFTVNDQPPIWAKYWAWVRTNSLTFQNLYTMRTMLTSVFEDFVYLEITEYQNNLNKWPVYSYTEGDRVRVIGRFVSGSPTVWAYDFPIVSLETDGAFGAGTYIKIPNDPAITSWGSGFYGVQTIEVYTPAVNTTDSLQLYYEFGENYPVLNPGTAQRSHGGMTQDQVYGVTPAIYVFTRGDFYIRQRLNFWIIDRAISDLYPSRISGVGRAFVVDPYAKEIYYPSTYRWSKEYQQETNINLTNRFYAASFDEVDRQRGPIEGLVSSERVMHILQTRGVGRVGVYNKFIKDSNGTNILSTSDSIITQDNVDYLQGRYGVGDQYMSITRSASAIYFVDPVRGYHIRIKENGMTAISDVHKGEFFIQPLFVKYNKPFLRANGFSSKIIGLFDYAEDEAILILQGGTYSAETIADYKFSFNEKRNAYSNFFDYHPEWMMCAEDVLYSWVGGALFVHNNTTTWNTFNGAASYPSITLVFNKDEPITKSFLAMAYQSNKTWVADITGYVSTSMINPQTGFQQQSQLKSVDFEIQENKRDAAFLKDANSGFDPAVALLEGDDLKGQWIEVTLTYRGTDFSWLYAPYINYIISQRNF